MLSTAREPVQGALIIALQREDVVLPGDLALRKAVRAALLPGKARQNRIDSSR
jgi:3-methyladenine DNA glycosylase/8-oxoguanine DNA glycosylase